jgi:hypothetical protein
MINASIHKLLLGKTETEAVNILNQFKCSWRVKFRDGVMLSNLSADRNDNRYNLCLEEGKVVNVLPG